MKEHIRRRYEEDYFRTTQEIAYAIDVRDSTNNPNLKAQQQSIIDKRVAHLQKIEQKLGREVSESIRT